MSTYTYKCSDCGNIFDIKATIKETEDGQGEKFACPKCQSKKIKQKFSAVNFFENILKNDNKASGCCSSGNACGTGCQPNKKTDDEQETKSSGCGCCN